MAEQTIPALEQNQVSASTKPVIRLENVYKTYDLGEIQVQALRGVSLEVPSMLRMSSGSFIFLLVS